MTARETVGAILCAMTNPFANNPFEEPLADAPGNPFADAAKPQPAQSFQPAPVDEPSEVVPAQTEANELEPAEADGKVYPFSWWKAGLSAFFLLVGFNDFSAEPGASLFFIIPSAWYLLMSVIYRDKLHKRRWLWVWAVAFACRIIF